jgi:hypothetical protein
MNGKEHKTAWIKTNTRPQQLEGTPRPWWPKGIQDHGD